MGGLTATEWVGLAGGAATAITAVVTAIGMMLSRRLDVQKHRLDKADRAFSNAKVAIESLDMVIQSLRGELEQTQADLEESRTEHTKMVERFCHQEAENANIKAQLDHARKRVERHSQSLVNLDTRLTHALRIRDTALAHIHERELWARERWPEHRPDTLPKIPRELIPEIARLVEAHKVREMIFPLPMPDGVEEAEEDAD